MLRTLKPLAPIPSSLFRSPFPVPRAVPVNVRSDSGQRPTLRSAMSAFGLDPGAPIAGRAICASMRPLDVYLYAFGAQSCATSLDLLRSARRGSDSDRAWHLGHWEARLATGAVSPEPLLRGHPRHVFAARAVARACYLWSAKTRRSREVTLVRYRTLRSTSTESALAIG